MRLRTKSIVFLSVVLTTFIVSNLMYLNLFFSYEVNEKIQAAWVFILIFCLIFIFFTSQYKFILSKKKILFIIVWEFFIISVFVSKAIHGNFSLLEYILYSIIIPLCFFSKGILKFKNTFMIVSVISIIPFFILLGPRNGLGMIICIAGLNLLNYLNIKGIKKIYIFLSMAVIISLLIITESRTSLASFFIVLIIFIIHTIFNRNIKSYFSLIKRGVVFLFVVASGYILFKTLDELFLNKWSMNSTDITSGRSLMWEDTIKNGINIFGNGENYFLHTYNIGDSHNIFIQILGSYGLISISLFLLIFLFIVFQTLKYRNNNEYTYYFVGFFLVGMGENLFFINSQLAFSNIIFFVYLGCLLNENKINKYKFQANLRL